MKTSVAKKLRDRVLAAFLAIAVMLSYVLPSAITASAAVDTGQFGTARQIEGSAYGVGFDEDNVNITVNGAELKDGDTVDLNSEFDLYLAWKFNDPALEKQMVDEGFPVAVHCQIPSDQIKNLGLNWHDGPTVDGKSGMTYEYYVDGTDVWIVIWDPGTKEKDFSGDMLMSAKLQATKDDADKEGKLSVKFFNKEIEVIVEDFKPALNVEKSAGEIAYDEKTGKFYVPFTVEVTSPVDADNVTLTDTFGHDDEWHFYVGTTLHDLELDVEEIEVGADGKINIGDLKANTKKTLTYSVEINPAWQGTYNQITATPENDVKPGQGSASVAYNKPSVNKSGQLMGNGSTIEWTLTFNAADLEKLDTDGAGNFVIKDTPDDKLEFTPEQKQALEALGAEFDGDSIKIPSSAFTPSKDWSGAAVYTLTYKTEVKEDYREPLFDTTVSNTVEVTFPDVPKFKDVTVTGKGDVTIKGIDKSGADKELVSEEGGRLSWQADLHLPHFENITDVEITDTTSTGYKKQYHKIDRDSVKITYTADGKDVTVSLSDVGTIIEDKNNPEEHKNDILKFTLNAEFIKILNDKNIRDLVITYDTVATNSSWAETGETDNTLTLENKIEFTVTSTEEGSPVTRSDTYTKTPRFGGQKWVSNYTAEEMQHIPGYDEGKYALRWGIKLDNSQDQSFVPEVGDVITIVDTLPKGYDITPDSWVLCVEGANGKDWYNAADKKITIETTDISDDQKEATISITIDEEVLNNLEKRISEWYKVWTITFYYETGMTDEAVAKLTERPSGQITNKADVLYDGEPAVSDLTADTWLTLGNDRVLDKYTLMENLSKAKEDNNNKLPDEIVRSDTNGDYILYKLDINKDGEYLGGLENGKAKIPTLTAVDTLGSALTFGGIVSGVDKDRLVVTSDENGQKLTFTLDNGVPYHIVYKVYINRIPPSGSVDLSKVDDMFNNKVELTGADEISYSKQSMLSSNVYHASASITGSTSNTYLEIKGTKLWKNDDSTKRPTSIEIEVVQKNKATGEEIKTITYTVDSEKSSSSENFEYTAEGDSWTFTIKNLVAKAYNGVEYSYDITEVEAEGYAVTYTGGNTDISANADITITNDASEEVKPETVDISINKVWVGGEGGNTSVTVTLSGTDGYSKDYEIKAADGWKLTVNDLPKYDSEGNEITYSVTEKNVEHYTSAVTKNSKYSFTVTNTVEKTNVSITKVWNGGEGGNTSVMVTLSGTDGYSKDYEIKAADGWKLIVNDLPKYDSEGNEITYSVTEKNVDHYTSRITKNGNSFSVINTVEKISISITKVWNGGTDRPDVTVTLNGTDGYSKDFILNAANDWTVTEKDLPKYDEKGNEIKYTVTEAAVTGYTSEVTNVGYDFTVTNTYKTTPQQPEEPKPTKVQISKQDITTGKELPGAHLKVVDKDGNTIKEWTSTEKPAYFENVFKAGETYTLIEETAPDGYVKAEAVEFTVNADGTVTQVVMKDDTTKVSISKKDITGDGELAGAKLQVKDSTGKVIDEWTSGTKPHEINGVLKAGEKYTLHEEAAPNGYAYASDIEFTVNKDGTVKTVVMKDDTTKVSISKKDITGGKELPGAHLKVVDENGNTVAEFDSTDKPTYFEAKFKAGETYTLIEETAPDGYVKAEAVEFTVSEDGSIDVVEMVDDTTKVQISKQDLTTGKELAGAKLKVVDKDGNVIKEWTSTDKPAYFENVFKAGETYTLIEETAPDGYVKAEAVEFTVNADGTVTQVVMKDDTTKVSISKKDITGDGELAGAKLQVLDKDGKVIDSWVSGDKPHEINGVLVAGEKYTLHEEVAPDGYKVANDIEFVVNADGTVTKVTMIDEAKNGTDLDGDSNDKDSGVAQGGGSNDKDTDNDESPKTGDSGNFTLIMLALALGVMAVTGKKRRNN